MNSINNNANGRTGKGFVAIKKTEKDKPSSNQSEIKAKPEYVSTAPSKSVLDIVENKKSKTTNFSFIEEEGDIDRSTSHELSVFMPENFEINYKNEVVCTSFRGKECFEVISKTPIAITAKARRHDNEDSYGAVVEWVTIGKVVKRRRLVFTPSFMLEDTKDFKKIMADSGCILCGDLNVLREFLTESIMKATDNALFTNKFGWHGDSFVMGEDVIGDANIFYQSTAFPEPIIRESGSLLDWQDNIAKYSVGNPNLMLGICTSFAAPLLTVLGRTGGGFSFTGLTSGGKSTILHAAQSVYSHQKVLDTWNTTVNGMEIKAETMNDFCMYLDEQSQCQPDAFMDITYLIANGKGKMRMSQDTTAARTKTWTVLYLSSSEKTIEKIASECKGKKEIKGGQQVRHVDITTTYKEKMFDNVYGMRPALFASTLKDNSGKYHGTVGRNWIEHIAKNIIPSIEKKAEISERITDFINDNVPENCASEIRRVMERFAIVCVSGEIAAECGLFGIDSADVRKEMKRAASDFLKTKEKIVETGNDRAAFIKNFRAFFELNQHSKFHSIGTQTSGESYGYRHERGGEVFFYISETALDRLSGGIDIKTALEWIEAAGYYAKQGKNSKHAVPAEGQKVWGVKSAYKIVNVI